MEKPEKGAQSAEFAAEATSPDTVSPMSVHLEMWRTMGWGRADCAARVRSAACP